MADLDQSVVNKLKHQVIIGIQFSEFDYAPKVDLNRNTGQNPWVHQITPEQAPVP